MPNQIICWEKQWKRTDDVIVWINVDKLNESWKKDRGYYLARGGRSRVCSRNKYLRITDWVKSNRPMFMPHVGLSDEGDISFTDGRHRFAWMRDHNVEELPVTTVPSEESEITRRFGTKGRTSYLR